MLQRISQLEDEVRRQQKQLRDQEEKISQIWKLLTGNSSEPNTSPAAAANTNNSLPLGNSMAIDTMATTNTIAAPAAPPVVSVVVNGNNNNTNNKQTTPTPSG